MLNIEKLFGWLFLFLGVLTIYWGLYYSFNMLTGKGEVPGVFKVKEEEVLLIPREKPNSPEDQLRQIMGEQLKELIPSDFLIQFSNITIWLIFMSVLVFAGAQVSGIGIKMIKK